MTIDKSSSNRNLKKEKNIVEGLVIAAVSMWLFVGMIIGIATSPDAATHQRGITAVGVIGDLCGLAYYAAPLSTMRVIIKTKDSSSLHMPTLCANLGNALMWIIYGIAGIQDPLVWVPNLLGGLLTCSQISLCILYRNPEKNKNPDVHDDDNYNPIITVIAEKNEIIIPVIKAETHKVFNDKILIKETELEDDLI
jgi:uncharacterized protein with PQ loop repeat